LNIQAARRTSPPQTILSQIQKQTTIHSHNPPSKHHMKSTNKTRKRSICTAQSETG